MLMLIVDFGFNVVVYVADDVVVATVVYVADVGDGIVIVLLRLLTVVFCF